MTFDAVCVTFIQNTYTARAEAVFYSHFHTPTHPAAPSTVCHRVDTSLHYPLHKQLARPRVALSLLTKTNGRQPLAFCLDAD